MFWDIFVKTKLVIRFLANFILTVLLAIFQRLSITHANVDPLSDHRL